MSPKTLIYIGMTVGGYIGGYIPVLWGAGAFSFQSIFFGMIGGLIGIWLGFRLSR